MLDALLAFSPTNPSCILLPALIPDAVSLARGARAAETLSARYRTASAFDGREGLKMASKLVPDVIISDIMMPQMSGDELVREPRQKPRLQALPVVLLTAKADDAQRVEMLRNGAQDYVMKPFRDEELLVRVDNQIAIAHTREVLQRELQSSRGDLELARMSVQVERLTRLIEALGGRIEFESEVGVGSTFVVVLPSAGQSVVAEGGTDE